jgi:hypothetical protein
MTAPTLTLHPEVRELLLEIAKDPRSTLFQTTPRERLIPATMDVESLSAGTAGWTPAERHLIAAYNEQVAVALGDAFHLLSTDNPESINFIGAGRGVGEQALERCAGLAGSQRFAGLDPGVQAILGRIVEGRRERLGLDEITTSILRLRGNHRSGNLHGMALILEGKHKDAAMLLRGIYADSLQPSVRYFAASNLAFVLGEPGGDLEAALEARIAAIRETPTVEGLYSVMLTACVSGKMEVARLSASYLNDQAFSYAASIAQVTPAFAARTWGSPERRTLEQFRSTTCGLAGRILDAVLG